MIYFELKPEVSECGNNLKKESVKVSMYREDEYNTNTNKFPLDLSEDDMIGVIERILNKHGKKLQDALELSDCFTIKEGKGTVGDKGVSFAMAHISHGKAVITEHYVNTTFKIKPKLKTFDPGYQNQKEYPLVVSGNLKIHRDAHGGH